MGRVLLLNGAGSAGKSSIARALQELLDDAWLHISMDGFLEMLHDRYHDHPDGFVYETTRDASGHPVVAVHVGNVGDSLLTGMRHAVAALAEAGNDLIVDDVILGRELDEYRRLLSNSDFHAIGVVASLEVLEAREAARGDRMIGLARGQFELVHRDKAYELTVDAEAESPIDIARRIKQHFRL